MCKKLLNLQSINRYITGDIDIEHFNTIFPFCQNIYLVQRNDISIKKLYSLVQSINVFFLLKNQWVEQYVKYYNNHE